MSTAEENDQPMSDQELASAAQGLILDAREEAPLSKARYDALVSEIELLALEAEEPEDIREIVAEPLLRLEPGGAFEDVDDDDDDA